MTSVANLVSSITEDGYVVVENLLSRQEVGELRQQFEPLLQHAPFGRNEFEGALTRRIYALLAKVPVVTTLVEHPLLLQIMDRLLPSNYLLSSAQAIQIHPGETPQAWHRDDSIDALPMPRQHFGVSTIWALDDFTAANGATELVPGSHRWGTEPHDFDAQARSIAMPSGSVLIFLANVVHRGGANNSHLPRLAISPQYCVPWMRQSENMLLAVPRATVRTYSDRIQSLLGYDVIAPGFTGHVNGRHPKRLLT